MKKLLNHNKSCQVPRDHMTTCFHAQNVTRYEP